jgi:hypothetical protein
MAIAAGGRTTTVTLAANTTVQIGTSSARPGDIRIGDQVSARVYRSGAAVIAERVHVLASSRQTRTIRGTVAALGHGTVTILARGKRYVVALSSSVPVTLNGKRVPLSSIHVGDRVDLRVQGTATPLWIMGASFTRTSPKQVTIRGTIGQVTAGGLVIVDASGGRHTVRLAAGVRPLLHGQPAPASALFPRVHARARGTMSGSTLIATSLAITVTARTVHGRIAHAGRGYLQIQATAGADIRVDLFAGISALDGNKRLPPESLPAGVYVRVIGWVEAADRLRATGLTVEHPSLSIAGTVVSTSGGLTVATATGERYLLRLASGSQIMASRLQLPLKAADIPAGVRVHVDGTIDTTGRLLVSAMTVRLSSVTLHGTLAQGNSGWDVKTASSTLRLRLQTDTSVVQGSHTLTLTDIVPGDSVTIYGYSLAQSAVLVRKLEVHRKLIELDGTVIAINPDGFDLQSADGQHHVVTSASTVVSGVATAIAAGFSVHVTGYLRGDGVILATRVRITKTR